MILSILQVVMFFVIPFLMFVLSSIGGEKGHQVTHVCLHQYMGNE
jgi:hypothetical protein